MFMIHVIDIVKMILKQHDFNLIFCCNSRRHSIMTMSKKLKNCHFYFRTFFDLYKCEFSRTSKAKKKSNRQWFATPARGGLTVFQSTYLNKARIPYHTWGWNSTRWTTRSRRWCVWLKLLLLMLKKKLMLMVVGWWRRRAIDGQVVEDTWVFRSCRQLNTLAWTKKNLKKKIEFFNVHRIEWMQCKRKRKCKR